jgi:BlaI family transcriptional regulator, penicillinase repressor
MHEGSGITEAEWRVMEVLWAEAPLTSREVIGRLADAADWSPKTVKTLLGRLVRKGALGYDEMGNRYLYVPRVARGEAVRAEGRSFVERIFGGDAAAALLHFARHAELSRPEVEELERLLDGREDER